MAFKKVDKEFCLSDESVNVYGYRCLSSGFLAERFNPSIGFRMHNRDAGVAVRWEDIRVGGDKIYGKPVVNLSAFPNLVDEIIDGFLAGASCGKIVALELSDDTELVIAGQTGPTVTKWFPREISIVDIPGNYNALAQLFDESDNVIRDLAEERNDKTVNQNLNMKQITLPAAIIAALSLSDNSSDSEINTSLQSLVDKASKYDTVKKQLDDLMLADQKKSVDAILAKGMSDNKLTKQMSEKLAVSYAKNPDGLKDLVDAMPAQVRVTSEGEQNVDVPAEYAGKSFQDLYLTGELEALKVKYPKYYEKLTKKS